MKWNWGAFSSIFLLFFSFFFVAAAQPNENVANIPPEPSVSFRPSVAIVVGIFGVMFTFTFLILMYAKFCRASAADLFVPHPVGGNDSGDPLPPRSSGVDKAVIESLPFFPFSSLRGSRDGLECAVCLSRFEDAEILRLLPRCKHAFHIACVDRWLGAHSTCPLCRHKVDAGDSAAAAAAKLSSSFRGSGDDRGLELFIERKPSFRRAGTVSSRFTLGGSFRRIIDDSEEEKDEALLAVEEGEGDGGLHKFKHRIIISDVVFKSRWSDVNSSDLVSLSSDMLNAMSSDRLTGAPDLAAGEAAEPGWRGGGALEIKEEMEMKRALESKARWMSGAGPAASRPATGGASTSSMIGSGERCQSEITDVSRFRVLRGEGVYGDERRRRVWLPIARRTVRWFAGKERRPTAPALAKGAKEVTVDVDVDKEMG